MFIWFFEKVTDVQLLLLYVNCIFSAISKSKNTKSTKTYTTHIPANYSSYAYKRNTFNCFLRILEIGENSLWLRVPCKRKIKPVLPVSVLVLELTIWQQVRLPEARCTNGMMLEISGNQNVFSISVEKP